MTTKKIISEIFAKYKGTYEADVLLYAHFPIALGLRPCAHVQWCDFQPELKPNTIEKNPETGATIIMIWTKDERKLGEQLGLEYIPYWPKLKGQRLLTTRRYYAVSVANKDLIDLLRNLPDAEEDMEMHGRLHGYPRDCIDAFAEDWCYKVIPDVRASEQIKSVEQKGNKINTLAYFAGGFVPCKPSCSNAIAIGQNIYNTYKTFNKEIARAYLDFTKKHVADLKNIDLSATHLQIFGGK